MDTPSGSRHRIAVLLVLGAAAAGLAGAAPPAPVSPGRPDRWAPVEGRCPSFSWTWTPGATAVELAVFALPDGADAATFDPAETEMVLFERLPGATSSWTPSLDRCLEPATRYAWYVRGLVGGGESETDDGAGWSRAQLFEVSARPSLDEVDAAMDVLLRHRAAEDHTAPAGAAGVQQRHVVARDGRGKAPPAHEKVGDGKVRDARPGTTPPRLRVEGLISGNGSELTSVDAETLDGIDGAALAQLADLASSGEAPVHWGNLFAVPAGFADGVDANSTYTGTFPVQVSAGNVISLSTSCSTDGLWRWTGASWTCSRIPTESILPNNTLHAGYLAANSVTNSEMADNAIRRPEIFGNEVQLYRVPNACGGTASDLTLNEFCFTAVCDTGPPIEWFTCGGSCSANGPQQCDNTLVGFLLSPTIPE